MQDPLFLWRLVCGKSHGCFVLQEAGQNGDRQDTSDSERCGQGQVQRCVISSWRRSKLAFCFGYSFGKIAAVTCSGTFCRFDQNFLGIDCLVWKKHDSLTLFRSKNHYCLVYIRRCGAQLQDCEERRSKARAEGHSAHGAAARGASRGHDPQVRIVPTGHELMFYRSMLS